MDFSQIALLFVTAAVFGVVAKLFNQPLFIGYLFAGIFLSAVGIVPNAEFFQEFSHIGIALLLFLMGLEMNLRDISEVGKPAIITALGQIALTFILGFGLGMLLNFGVVASLYVSIALTFSSTIIAVRLMSDKKDLNSLYGRFLVAILLVQDFAALIIMMFLAGPEEESVTAFGYIWNVLKGLILIILVFILSKKTLPVIFEKLIAKSSDLMFILSIAWVLGISAFVARFTGFSLEVGGFLAGIALSGLPEHLQIANKTKPLRDFFLIIFFLMLGTNFLLGGEIFKVLPEALILSVFVIMSHTFIIMFLMGAMGYKKRTAFLVGLTGSQVSEFSLIIASTGLMLTHINNYYLSLISLIGVITMSVSTYLINYADDIYTALKKYLKVFEREATRENLSHQNAEIRNHIILIGCDRTGKIIAKYLENKGLSFVVVDFNPKVYRELEDSKIPVVFGDINDSDVAGIANLESARLVISTISNLGDNLSFLTRLRNYSNKPKTLFTASSKSDGIELYKNGADFVIVPEMVAGDFIKNLLKSYGLKTYKLTDAGTKHFERLKFI